jgi:PilZ domain
MHLVTFILPATGMLMPASQVNEQNMPKPKPKSATTLAKANGEDSLDNRDFRRRSVLWPAKIIVGTHELACQIWNLSLGGARVRIDLPIQEGTDVSLAVEGRGEIAAQVAWSTGGSLGLDFLVGPDAIKRMFEDRLHILGLDAEA